LRKRIGCEKERGVRRGVGRGMWYGVCKKREQMKKSVKRGKWYEVYDDLKEGRDVWVRRSAGGLKCARRKKME
jgi:hypothetical protein